MLASAGGQFASHDPETWPKQAELARDGKWDELKKWQDELDGGKVIEQAAAAPAEDEAAQDTPAEADTAPAKDPQAEDKQS